MLEMKDLYWAAGFLDGEGSFGYWGSGVNKPKGGRYHYLCVSAGQKDRELLDRLFGLFGGYIHHRSTQDIYTWQVNGVSAAGAMMTLFSLLSTRRKLKIKEALAKWKAGPLNKASLTRNRNRLG